MGPGLRELNGARSFSVRWRERGPLSYVGPRGNERSARRVALSLVPWWREPPLLLLGLSRHEWASASASPPWWLDAPCASVCVPMLLLDMSGRLCEREVYYLMRVLSKTRSLSSSKWNRGL